MKRTIAITLAVLAVLATLGGAAQAGGSPRIRIDRIYFDSPGTDTGSNSSLNDEWIRLENRGTASRSIQGWTIRDTSSHVYRFGSKTLAPGAVVYVHTGSGSNTGRHKHWGLDYYVWNNDGDRATLKNRSGTVIDRCSYTGTSDAVNC